MKAALIAATLIGGASGAVTMYVLASPEAGSSRNAKSAAPIEGLGKRSGALDELRKAVAALETENLKLQTRLDLLDVPRETVRAPVQGFVTKSEFDDFQREMRDLLGTRAASAPVEELEGQVTSALIEIRKQEQFDKVREYHEKRSARLDQDLEKMGEWLALNASQVEDMRSALLVQYGREAEISRRWEEGEDPEVLGEAKRADGEAFDRDLREFLTEEQATTFWDGIRGRKER